MSPVVYVNRVEYSKAPQERVDVNGGDTALSCIQLAGRAGEVTHQVESAGFHLIIMSLRLACTFLCEGWGYMVQTQ